MQQKCDDGEHGADPHECKHLDANLCANVELVLGGQGDPGGDANDGGDDGGDNEYNDGEQADDGEEEREQAAARGKGREEEQDGVEDGTGHETAVHDLGADAQELEDGDDLRGESNPGTGEQLANEDLDGVEPIELLWPGAKGDAFIDIAFAKVPQTNRVEIVQAQTASDRVEQL